MSSIICCAYCVASSVSGCVALFRFACVFLFMFSFSGGRWPAVLICWWLWHFWCSAGLVRSSWCCSVCCCWIFCCVCRCYCLIVAYWFESHILCSAAAANQSNQSCGTCNFCNLLLDCCAMITDSGAAVATGNVGNGARGEAVENNSRSWCSCSIWLTLMAINKCILCSKQANRIRCWTARCSIKHRRASKSSASKALTAASSRTLSWRFMWTERHAIPKFTNQSELSAERRSQRSHAVGVGVAVPSRACEMWNGKCKMRITCRVTFAHCTTKLNKAWQRIRHQGASQSISHDDSYCFCSDCCSDCCSC